jgi:hypothetical protein
VNSHRSSIEELSMAAKNPTRDRDARRHVTRRSLIKWSLATGAFLGVPRWKIFEILEGAGGKALAAEAACHPTNRSVHIIAGVGGFAWFQLLWPHNDVAAAANPGFAWHAIGEQTMANGTDMPLTLGPEAPWQGLSGRLQVTALMSGSNETHTETPSSSSTLAAGTSLFAACASLQTTNPTLVPVIAVDNAPFGTAAGAPRVARVGDADQIVSLFNSAASRAGGLLAQPSDAELYDASYKALLSLNAAAGTPATLRSFSTGKTASSLLGTNLADALMPSGGDLARYGITGSSPTKLVEIAKTLVTTAKAFAMGLTSCVILPAFRDDPHGAFNDMANLRATVQTLGATLDAFRADLMAVDDPSCAGKKLGENVVISIHGDTPKNPLDRSGWPDGTPGNSNWSYVLGAGHLRTGWFGGIDRAGNVAGWNPQTGAPAAMSSSDTAMSAAAAIAFAVAKGDMRRVNDFYQGVAISGVVNGTEM